MLNVIVHDPQPLPFIKFCDKRQPWVWRCHVDLSKPQGEFWDYLKAFILRYDIVVISDAQYRRKDLPVEQRVIFPSIDPLSWKNVDLPQETIDSHLHHYNIPRDKPLITQISRFDKWKDPVGVVRAFAKIRKQVDCKLVLLGNMAQDEIVRSGVVGSLLGMNIIPTDKIALESSGGVDHLIHLIERYLR